MTRNSLSLCVSVSLLCPAQNCLDFCFRATLIDYCGHFDDGNDLRSCHNNVKEQQQRQQQLPAVANIIMRNGSGIVAYACASGQRHLWRKVQKEEKAQEEKKISRKINSRDRTTVRYPAINALSNTNKYWVTVRSHYFKLEFPTSI